MFEGRKRHKEAGGKKSDLPQKRAKREEGQSRPEVKVAAALQCCFDLLVFIALISPP